MKRKIAFYLISVSMFFGSLSDSGKRYMLSSEDFKFLTHKTFFTKDFVKSLGVQLGVQKDKKKKIRFSAHGITHEPIQKLAKDKENDSKKAYERESETTYSATNNSWKKRWKGDPTENQRAIFSEPLLVSVPAGGTVVYSALGKIWTDSKTAVLTLFGISTAEKRFLALRNGFNDMKDEPIAINQKLNTSKQTIKQNRGVYYEKNIDSHWVKFIS